MALQEMIFGDDEELIARDPDLSDTVDGLTYVVDWGEDKGLVGLYAKQLDTRVRGVEALLRSMNPNVRGVCARMWN